MKKYQVPELKVNELQLSDILSSSGVTTDNSDLVFGEGVGEIW